MKSPGRFIPFFILFVVSILFLNVSRLLAQDVSTPVSDSAQIETIDMDYVSTESLDIIQKVERITEDLITEEELQELKRESDSLVALIEPKLRAFNKNAIKAQDTRQLKNMVIYWKQEQQLIEDQISAIRNVLQDMDGSRSFLAREISEWTKIDESIEDDESLEVFRPQINEALKALKAGLELINVKSKTTARLIRKVSMLDNEIESTISDLEELILSKQQHLLVSNQPSFFDINYADKNNWSLTIPLSRFYKVDLRNLKNYIIANLGILFFHLLLIIGLISLFVYINREYIKNEKNEEDSFFKKQLKVILSRPVSAALIIGLFASVILYPNKPLIFNDMMRLFVILPIVLILIGILQRKYHFYVYVFGTVILLQLVYIHLPTSNIISRFILLVIALLEVGALGHFIMYYKRQAIKKDKLGRFILVLCYIHLTMAAIGLIGNILGKVMLAELFLFAVVGNALAVTLITLSLVVVNGFVILFIEGRFAGRANVVKRNRSLLINKVTRFFNIVAFIILIYYVLKIIGWETAVFDGIYEWFEKERNIGSMIFTWSKLFVFFFVIWLSIAISKIVRAILEDDVLDKMKLEKGLPHTISMMFRYTLVTLGVFIAMAAADIPMSDFAIIFGAFGIGIGFGLQNIFNNLVSGLILLFERPIKIGDTIEVGTLMGNVKSIGIRSSNVRTFDGAEIIVPNGNLISNEVVNWTLSDQRRRIEVIVGVSYNSDPHQVHDILLKILKEHKDIVNDPEPNVLFRDLGESSLDFRMLFWTLNYDQWIRIKSEIIFMVFDELKAANIEIPFPQRDLHLRSIEPNIEIKKL